MLHLKIALRAFLKSKGYNFLNIAGLALGLATFTFVSLYVANETSYDEWNGNMDRVFLVERETPNGASPYTPGKLAAAIKNACPEVEETGRMNTALFQLPFFTNSGRFLIKNWVGADYSLAGMLGIKPMGFHLTPNNAAPTVLLSRRTAEVLFPGESDIQNKTVMMMSRSGMPMTIAGVAEDAPGNTNFSFDCIGFSEDITQGKDQSYANQIYRTFLLVKPGTDIGLLSRKIDQIYREAALADTSMVAREALAMSDAPTIFLDPLKNLHLKPHYGSHVNDQIVKGLVVLALIILIVTGVNFTNLYVSQANRRAKEVGIKKVSGISKQQIVFQFLAEIFSQCIVATLISFGIVALGLPYFNQLLDVNLSISGINGAIAMQLLLAVIALTLLAGAYPALVMAGFRPAEVLRGNQFEKGGQFSWTKGVIPVLQFTFAIGFVIVLIIINQQISFMKSEDPGFQARQVLYIDNMAIYNTPAGFESVNARIKAIPGVKDVAVSSHVPGGIMPASHEYVIQNKTHAMQTVAVGYHYFETLNIRLKQGQTFSSSFPVDSANAVINETAARNMGLANPVGTMIKGRSGHYRIIGVTKDVKSSGFESYVQPTVYLMNNPLGAPKTQIMISVEGNAIPAVLATLGREWNSINKLDGDNFNYHFLDELYGKLYAKQEQLQSILTYFSILAVLIASLGFFASAAQAIHLRMKEIAVRKVFGARGSELMLTLGTPFFYIILIANLIAWPTSLVIASKWLQTFAYRVDISFQPFVAATIISLLIVATTVCLQISRAVNLNLALKLKE
ncbi:putative ABC transport system permease protein [Dyadobacter soli]|uniref:Putative ABC transport system permease protein n=1 Tax=Dyadobacter soli TaxID=659014 RepID=A0A1G7LWG3_9BACT|nr:ABC transporter permease [Dyadobacter soli]SDF53847.1 putative ABC transport system permease protein [Dyadobacter soli]